MIHSLRFRLLLTLLGVTAVALGTVAVVASRSTASAFRRYVELDLSRNQLLVDTLLGAYAQPGAAPNPAATAEQVARAVGERVVLTDGSGAVLADSRGLLVGQALGCAAAVPAVVITIGASGCVAPVGPAGGADALGGHAAGSLIFFSLPLTGTAPIAPEPGGDVLKMLPPGQAAGALGLPPIAIRRTPGAGLDPIAASFIATVNGALAVAVASAGLAALLLTLVLGRRILRPVAALTAAARALENGDLGRRVAVRGRDEIGALAKAFNAMADGLARHEQLRRTMVSDVAHELRTPLTNIRGYLEALRDGVARPEPALFDSLHEEALLLNRLIDDLQDVALADAGQLRLARQPVDLAALAAQALAAVEPQIQRRGLSARLEVPATLPVVYADAERIGQVLRNLLRNALAHTPAGGTITVAAEPAAGEVAVSVRDTGVGIAPAHLPLIFERFYRADPARARATGGTGLGLTIVRQLVEAHGGRVSAASAPGQGSAFTFTLPTAGER